MFKTEGPDAENWLPWGRKAEMPDSRQGDSPEINTYGKPPPPLGQSEEAECEDHLRGAERGSVAPYCVPRDR